MKQQPDRQLRLAAFGFDARACEGFRLTFRGPGKGRAVLVDERSAEFGIFNMDAADAPELLARYRQRYPGRPAIRLSVKDPTHNDALYVKKPASIGDMLAAVERLIGELDGAQKIEAQSETTTVDIQPRPATPARPGPAARSKTAAASLYYHPKDYLQGEIHAAIEYARSRELVVELWLMCAAGDWKKIIFLPRLQKVLTSLSERELRTYCSSPLSFISHKLYRRNEKESALIQAHIEREGRGACYEAFCWKVALFTSQGRLPSGTRLDAAAQLKQWPNLTRLYPLTGAMRIATLLVDRPRPLPLIAKVLKLPAGRVFAFYSAACAIGIVAAGNEAVELPRQSLPQRHRDHTLLGRILKRLKNDAVGDLELSA